MSYTRSSSAGRLTITVRHHHAIYPPTDIVKGITSPLLLNLVDILARKET